LVRRNCLRSWLEQDTSCPTCRKSLNDEKDAPARTPPAAEPEPAQPAAEAAAPQQPQVRSLFHFDGSRYISWLPSFSLQVTNSAALLPGLLGNRAPLSADRLAEMSGQVAQMFAHVPVELIQQDLNRTHSVEVTIENILEGRLAHLADEPRQRLLDDDSDTEDELFGENSSEDELVVPMSGPNDNLNANNNVFSSILNNLSQASSGTPAGRASRSSPRSANSAADPAQASEVADARILAKYAEKPELSESANSLIQRKRQLVLNSKK
jgi:hypothetical protein